MAKKVLDLRGFFRHNTLMTIIKIEATENATHRTKNRIKERGPWFAVERKHDDETFGFAPSVHVKEGWLLREIGGGDGDTWLGWLWKNEFKVIESEGGH